MAIIYRILEIVREGDEDDAVVVRATDNVTNVAVQRRYIIDPRFTLAQTRTRIKTDLQLAIAAANARKALRDQISPLIGTDI